MLWLQLLKCDYLLISFLLYDSKLIIFGQKKTFEETLIHIILTLWANSWSICSENKTSPPHWDLSGVFSVNFLKIMQFLQVTSSAVQFSDVNLGPDFTSEEETGITASCSASFLQDLMDSDWWWMLRCCYDNSQMFVSSAVCFCDFSNKSVSWLQDLKHVLYCDDLLEKRKIQK